MTEKTPLLVRCRDCQHRWAVAYLPMELMKVATVVRSAHCPACGGPPTQIVIAGCEEPAPTP